MQVVSNSCKYVFKYGLLYVFTTTPRLQTIFLLEEVISLFILLLLFFLLFFVIFFCPDSPVITSFLLLVVLIILPPCCCGAVDALLIELVFTMKGWNITLSVCCVLRGFDHKLSHIEKKCRLRIHCCLIYPHGHNGVTVPSVWSVFFFLCLIASCSFIVFIWRCLSELFFVFFTCWSEC